MGAPGTLSLNHYSLAARSFVQRSQRLADERQQREVTPLHLLHQVLSDLGGAAVFRGAGADVEKLLSQCEEALQRLPAAREPSFLSEAFLALLERAEKESQRERAAEVSAEALLNALVQELRGPAGELLQAAQLGPGALRPHLALFRQVPRGEGSPAPAMEALRNLLQHYGQPEVEPVVGRVRELRRIVTVLERRQKRHPLLIGEAGVGKRALIRGFALRLLERDVPFALADCSLWELDWGQLQSGARSRGEVESRLVRTLQQLDRSEGEAIVVVPEVDRLLGGGPLGTALSELLRPFFDGGRLRWLLTVTPAGRARLQEKDPGLLRWLTPIDVEEPTEDQAVEILRGVARRWQTFHRIDMSDAALVAAVRLGRRYLGDRFLPESALELLDESAAHLRVTRESFSASDEERVRRLATVETQLESLGRAADEATERTRTRLAAERDALAPQVVELRQTWERRRGLSLALSSLKEEEQLLQSKLTEARDRKDLGQAAELEHVRLPALRSRLAEAQAVAGGNGLDGTVPLLSESDVGETLARWTGIPASRVLEGEADKLLHMESRLEERVLGQDEAVRAVARAVRRGRVGLRDAGRPIGSFLFLGPSGVGKTELAKTLAEQLFDDEQALTRLDMSEFMEKHMAQRLIGAPPGYADSAQGGFLTEAVRRRPYSVLLFDEVEKAHQDVFNLLLQLLDDGRLTDGRGQLADFTNTVIILTSNLGASRLLAAPSEAWEGEEALAAMRGVVQEELNAFFRPELLNRIDDIVIFRPLARESLERIFRIHLKKLQRMVSERGWTLEVSAEVEEFLVTQGYEPALGARPLKRAILKHLQDPLAEALLQGGSMKKLRAIMDGGRVRFESQP